MNNPTGGTVSCTFSNEGGSLVSVCVESFTVGSCIYTTTSIGTLTLGTNSYTVTGRTVTVTSGTGCTEQGRCEDYTVHATRTGPPPEPCPHKSLEDVKEMLLGHAMQTVRRP